MKYPALMLASIAHCLATLLHFTHNGIFLNAYPNLPASITVPVIAWTWIAITAIGVMGWFVLLSGRALAGLLLIGCYAAFGFDGLAHYGVAPMSAHNHAMNLTIWLEAITAAVLLIFVGAAMRSCQWRRRADNLRA